MYDKNNVIIIEEADQLSEKAKLALLKVLEKPQNNTYFILLSMYNTGLPTAIQSRCQKFIFKSFSTVDIMYALKYSLEKLNLWESDDIPKSFRIEGLRAIAEASQGSLREATQYLEKCLIGEYWTSKDIKDNLGILDSEATSDILSLLLNKDTKFFQEFDKVDIKEFFDFSYSMLSNAYAHYLCRYVNCPEEHLTKTKRLGDNPNIMEVLDIYSKIYENSTYLKKSYMLSQFCRYFTKEIITCTKSPSPTPGQESLKPIVRRVVADKGV